MSHGRPGDTRHMAETPPFTAPGLKSEDAGEVIALLDERLAAAIDLSLTLKHIHWNVVGPHFIGVHEMLDPQYEGVTKMVDALAERIATLGGVPRGTPQHVVDIRDWDDYDLDRATASEHLGALDLVYTGVIEDHRKAQGQIADLDPVTEDLLIGHIGELELYQWFVRAHLQSSSGRLSTEGAETERQAAKQSA